MSSREWIPEIVNKPMVGKIGDVYLGGHRHVLLAY
jgi:hypothetical protein